MNIPGSFYADILTTRGRILLYGVNFLLLLPASAQNLPPLKKSYLLLCLPPCPPAVQQHVEHSFGDLSRSGHEERLGFYGTRKLITLILIARK